MSTHPATGDWHAMQPSEVSELLAPLKSSWWVAGGWALDLYLEKQTRPHRNFDVGVLRRDIQQVFDALPSWEFYAASRGKLVRLGGDETPNSDVHSLWCRSGPAASWTFELLLDSADEDWWIFRRDPHIRRPLATITRLSADGIPYLAPEIQLLYKAKSPRPLDQVDFESVVARLDWESQAWLRAAIDIAHPTHKWLAGLKAAP